MAKATCNTRARGAVCACTHTHIQRNTTCNTRARGSVGVKCYRGKKNYVQANMQQSSYWLCACITWVAI
jgi:hypothetical protein